MVRYLPWSRKSLVVVHVVADQCQGRRRYHLKHCLALARKNSHVVDRSNSNKTQMHWPTAAANFTLGAIVTDIDAWNVSNTEFAREWPQQSFVIISITSPLKILRKI